jgi:hypothetical protein
MGVEMNSCNDEINLCVIQGDEKSYNLAFTSGGSPLDITGAIIKMSIKRSIADNSPLISKTVTGHTDPANGKTTITLSTTDTGQAIGNYYYDIQISGASIPKKTVMKGKMAITWQATKD